MSRALLTISPYTSRQRNTGGARRIHYLNRGLARAGWDVFQFSMGTVGAGEPVLSRTIQIADGYREHLYINPVVIIANRIIKELGGPQVAPSLLPLFCMPSGTLRREIARCDIVMLEHPHHYGFIRGRLRPGQKLVLDAHNIEFRLYENGRRSNPVSRIAKRKLFANEAALFREADLVFTCTEEDRQTAIETFGAKPERIIVASNGCDATGTVVVSRQQRLSSKITLGLEGRLVAFFAGSRWAPNIEAGQHIIKMAAELPDTIFLIAGSAGEALRGRLTPNVRILGFVDDLEPLMAASDLALNPITSGGGSNIKMFDYLGAALPVITTPFGARGAEPGDDFAIVKCELADFPTRICEILAAPDLEERRIAARRLALEQYDWDAIARLMASRIEGMLEECS